MFKTSFVFRLLLFGALSILALPAFASTSVTVVSNGGGVFTVNGVGLQKVSGIQLSIPYDSTSTPTVVPGGLVSGMMNAINPANPIRVGIVSLTPIGGAGSGTILTITFPSGDGRILGMSGSLLDSNRAIVATQFYWPADTTTASDPSGASGSGGASSGNGSGTTTTTGGTTTTAGTGSSQPFVVGGTVTLPSNETAAKENKEPAAQPVPQEIPERQVMRDIPTSAPEASEPPSPKAAVLPIPAPKPVQSVLEKFKHFEGEKTAKSLTALFDRDSAASCSQSPLIGIADGKATVKLSITKVPGDKAPSFAFNSARHVALTRVGDGEWEVVVRPDKGVVSASVSMLLNGTAQEFPLTVTPKVDVDLNKSGAVDEADFKMFLKERGTAAAPKYDLNGDGVRDYLDDYIFTANYLLKVEEKGGKKTAPKI